MCESPLGLWKKMGDPDILVQKNKLFWLLLSSKDQINGCCGPQMTDGLPLENLGSNLLCHARSVVWVRVPMSLLGIMSIVHHLNSPPYVNSPPSHCPPMSLVPCLIGARLTGPPSHWSQTLTLTIILTRGTTNETGDKSDRKMRRIMLNGGPMRQGTIERTLSTMFRDM